MAASPIEAEFSLLRAEIAMLRSELKKRVPLEARVEELERELALLQAAASVTKPKACGTIGQPREPTSVGMAGLAQLFTPNQQKTAVGSPHHGRCGGGGNQKTAESPNTEKRPASDAGSTRTPSPSLEVASPREDMMLLADDTGSPLTEARLELERRILNHFGRFTEGVVNQKAMNTPATATTISGSPQRAPPGLTLEVGAPGAAVSAQNSLGSLKHPNGCKPCAWFWKRPGGGGCENGARCAFCHKCDETELKNRKKEKVAKLRDDKRKADAEQKAAEEARNRPVLLSLSSLVMC